MYPIAKHKKQGEKSIQGSHRTGKQYGEIKEHQQHRAMCKKVEPSKQRRE